MDIAQVTLKKVNLHTKGVVLKKEVWERTGPSPGFRSRGPKTTRATIVFNTILDVCSKRGAKNEMGSIYFKWGGRTPLTPAGDGPGTHPKTSHFQVKTVREREKRRVGKQRKLTIFSIFTILRCYAGTSLSFVHL